MKKILSMAALAVLSFTNAQKLEGGYKFGYVNSTVQIKSNVYTENLKPLSSIYLTAFYEYKFNQYLSAQAELGVMGLGATNFPSDDGTKNKLNIAVAYLPIGIKFYPIENRLSIGTGINFGISTVYGRENGEKVRYRNFNRGNHSYYAGIEYKITNKILAEFKYSRGLNKIFNGHSPSLNHNFHLKNNFFQIGVGYIVEYR